MRFPGHTKPGGEPSAPIYSLDLLPTFCELAGVPLPEGRHLDGTSLVPLFSGEPIQRRQPMFWHYFNALGEPKLAMRDGDWMIVATTDQEKNKAGSGFRPSKMPLIKDAKAVAYELYNMAADRSQRRDLATEQPERTASMARQLNAIFKGVQAEGPDWRTPPTK